MAPDPTSPSNFDALSPLAHEVAEAMARVASDIALVVDRDGVIRSVAAGASPLPAECSRWVGQRWVDTASADSRRKIELLLDEAGSGAIPQRREVNHPVIDGDAVPVAWTAIRLGEHGPVVAVGRDLRAVAAIQRRFLDSQHEMELDYWQRRHADNRWRALFHVARDAVMVLDADSLHVVEANDAARRILGDAKPPTRVPVMSLVPEAARAPLAELLAAARTTGRGGEIRLRVAAAGPSAAPPRGAASASELGGTMWAVSATPFVTEGRQQLLLRARDHDGAGDDNGDAEPALMRALVESTTDAIVITDSAGRIQLANPAFLSLVQQTTESQVKGRGLPDVVGDRGGTWRDTLARTRLEGLTPRTPLVVMRGGSLEIAVEVVSTVLTDGDQELLGFTLRTVEPPRASAALLPTPAWPELDALRAQVGLVPLDALLQDAAAVVERRIIRTALRRAAGQVDVAARLLGTDPLALSLRLHRLELLPSGSNGGSDGDAGGAGGPGDATPPRRMN